MGASYSSGVAYGYAIQEADTEVLELLESLAEDGDNPTHYGLNYKAFKEEFPDLNFQLAGYDGDNAAIVVYAEISRSDLSMDSASGAWALPAIGGDGDTDAQLEKFSEKYGIFAEPSWVAYSWVC